MQSASQSHPLLSIFPFSPPQLRLLPEWTRCRAFYMHCQHKRHVINCLRAYGSPTNWRVIDEGTVSDTEPQRRHPPCLGTYRFHGPPATIPVSQPHPADSATPRLHLSRSRRTLPSPRCHSAPPPENLCGVPASALQISSHTPAASPISSAHRHQRPMSG